MPIYEYKCQKCSLRFEVRRHFGEDGATPCPQCGIEAHRLFSAVPIIFKGSGFYVTDSRKNHDRPLEESKTEKSESDTKPTKPQSS